MFAAFMDIPFNAKKGSPVGLAGTSLQSWLTVMTRVGDVAH